MNNAELMVLIAFIIYAIFAIAHQGLPEFDSNPVTKDDVDKAQTDYNNAQEFERLTRREFQEEYVYQTEKDIVRSKLEKAKDTTTELGIKYHNILRKWRVQEGHEL